MTLPANVTLPIETDLILADKPEKLLEAIKKLTFVIGNFIQETNQAVNGRTYQYTPFLTPDYEFIIDTTGTVTYTDTILWARRVNGMVFVWFDINWNNHGGAGPLLIRLPYFSQPSNEFPYIGVVESDGVVFTAGYTYLTANLLPDTNTIEIHQNGSGVPSIPLPVTVAGHLRGSIVYAGQQFR